MDAKDLRIVFMGTPEFAVPSLRALVGGGYNVVGVVTSPDKPAGRGQKIHRSEVKIAALELGLPVLQPEKLKAPEFVEALEALRPDLGIVIAFRMLPEVVWAMPRLGTFNLHASLLPQYRGAAPINWAIINGETETGVTTFLLNHEIDKGGIIGQIRVPILPEDNVGTLYERLMTTGTSLVTETVDRIAAGEIWPVEQQHIDEATLRPAPKIFKEDCRIDWEKPGREIVNFVRGLSPYPAAWTEMYREGDGAASSAKIFSASFEAAVHGEACGTLQSDGRTFIRVACADGWIALGELQIAGKKRLAVRERMHTTEEASRGKPLLSCNAGASDLLAEFPSDLLFRQRFGAEKPVVALRPFGNLLLIVALHRHDHLVARTPVGGQRDAEGVDGLQAHQNPPDLVEIAAQSQRIVDHRPQHALRVDEEHGAHGGGLALAGLDHAVERRHFHRNVVDDREPDFHILHALVLDLLADGLEPCDMAVAAVDRQADQFAVQRPELLGTRPESEYFGGADRGEIGRVAEKNHPFALVIVREADLPLGGHGLECRNRLAEPRHLLFVLFHKSEFLKVYTRTCKVDALPEFIFQDTEFAGTLSADFPPHTEAYTQTAFSDRRTAFPDF